MSTPSYTANDCKEILFTSEEIDAIITELAEKIDRTYENSGHPLVMVVVLKGSMPFAADLARKLKTPIQMEFMKVSSYGAGTHSSGKLKFHLDMQRENIENDDILIVEDIVDSGNTLSTLAKLLRERNPHSLRVCALLDKPARREVDFSADFNGAVIEDKFVVGYGLDFNENYRSLPFIGVLKEEIYS